eukprot:TRINITY_DN2424_c0_g1_i3.p1 TRINITY_DN2424_c0_g1~~TRINITY_DN2424_c0_g1_i3.p1  ORF type:complete len:456 (-),score=105.87 TRINITY_DN2424_c0_g1_i3:101-1423(-)
MEAPQARCCAKIPLKFKILIIIGTIVVVIGVSVGILLGAIVPAVVQSRVGSSTLTFSSMEVVEANPGDFRLKANGIVDNAGKDASQIQSTVLQVSYKGQHLGTLPLSTLDVQGGKPTSFELQENFVVEDFNVYDDFSKDLVNGEEVVWHLSGKPSVKALGMTFKNIKFEKDVPIKGFSGFLKDPIIINKVETVGGSPGKLDLIIDLSIPNPSSLEMNVGNTTFDLYVGPIKIATTTFNLTLKYGVNNFTIKSQFLQPGRFDAPSNDTGRKFLSKFLLGKDNVVVMTGSPNHKNLLQRSLTFLAASAVVPGIKDILVLQSRLAVSVIPPQTNTIVTMRNPFATSFEVHTLNFDIFDNTTNKLTAQILNWNFDTPVRINARSRGDTTPVKLSNLNIIGSITNFPGIVIIKGSFVVSIPKEGGFKATIDHEVYNLKNCITGFC